MHLLIPFAAPLPAPDDPLPEPAELPSLPRLQRLLGRWAELQRDDGEETSFSPPHERALARALGWQGDDGRLPWAAWMAEADGIDTGGTVGSTGIAWGLLTPAHWLLGTDQVSLTNPALLSLDDRSSRTFFSAVEDLFTGEGQTLHYGAPLRWYAAHDSLAAVATASLDRVVGRNVDAWFGSDPCSPRLRRLQSEVQMLLYTHPLNDEREAQSLPTVNSFWLSGCGARQLPVGAAPEVDDRLRGPALGGDRAAWTRAWETLDEGPLARLLDAATADDRLTLCGERSSVTYCPGAGGMVQRMRRRWSMPTVASVLQTL